ncbi:CRISPR-associated endonuclease Cas1 [Streptomyces asiaticus]
MGRSLVLATAEILRWALDTDLLDPALLSLRTTPLHPAIGFLHSDTDRRRNTLALDLAEPFKPLFAERLLKRAASQKKLKAGDFETDMAKASLSKDGRRKLEVTLGGPGDIL